MNVLFVSRETREQSISAIVFAQGESLKSVNVGVDYFPIRGKGAWGYVRSIFALRAFLKKNSFAVVHAHYSLSGFVAALAGSRPLVVSLMGSDILSGNIFRRLIRFFASWRWSALIVKSDAMKSKLGMDCAQVIPNGVDMERFRPLSRTEAKKKAGFHGNKNIIFVGDPERHEKNFTLAEATIAQLNDENINLHVVCRQPHETLPIYMSAADVLLLTSLYEGSPNVIKEAMACACPIVATEVGDVRWVLGNTPGCFIASFSTMNVADKISRALELGQRTNGRERVIELGLDNEAIARRLMQVYEKVVESR